MIRHSPAWRVLPVRADHDRADGFAAGSFMMHDHGFAARRFVMYHDRCGSMVMFGQDDDLVVSRGMMIVRTGFPSGRGSRTRLAADPLPDIAIKEPAFIIRDVFILVEDVAVLRDRHRFRTGHNDRFFNDRGVCFHDDRFFNDRGVCFHDDRGRTRFDDRAHQVHDISRQLDAVARTGVVVIPCESGRGEDDRSSESSADNECLVDGLLNRFSYGERLRFVLPETKSIFDFLIILYSELFVLSN